MCDKVFCVIRQLLGKCKLLCVCFGMPGWRAGAGGALRDVGLLAAGQVGL